MTPGERLIVYAVMWLGRLAALWCFVYGLWNLYHLSTGLVVFCAVCLVVNVRTANTTARLVREDEGRAT